MPGKLLTSQAWEKALNSVPEFCGFPDIEVLHRIDDFCLCPGGETNAVVRNWESILLQAVFLSLPREIRQQSLKMFSDHLRWRFEASRHAAREKEDAASNSAG